VGEEGGGVDVRPIEPVVPDIPTLETTTYAKNQPEYLPLPAIRLNDGIVVTRWGLTWRERLRVLLGGSMWLVVKTFHRPLQPVLLTTECPIKDPKEQVL